MPVTPNLLERLLFRFDKAPAPVLDLFGAGGFEAVALALDLGLFEALADGDLSAVELADRLDADSDGLRVLLEFLSAQGYVAEDGGAYRNTATTATWLTTDSETNMGPWLTFWKELVFPFWDANLETVVRTGEPTQTIYEWFDEEPSRWDVAQEGFRAAASIIADEVAGKVTMPDSPVADGSSRDDPIRLLDVGGGHGLYAVELCRRHPHLSATVFDVPPALDAARAEIADADLDDRIDVRGGDYWTDDMGDGYDLALAFNVVHAHDAAENVHLFERVADALAPGGRIAVLDQFEGSARTPVGKAGVGFVGLTYFVTLGATIHPFEEVAEWLRAAGFEDVNRTPIRRAGPGNTLVEATKAGDSASE